MRSGTTSSQATSEGGPDGAGGAAGRRTERIGLAALVRGRFHAVVPRHWTVLLGQTAVGSFVVLVLSGIYLELFFDPSMAPTVYDGPHENLRGVVVSRAYDSALAISFEVRGGLFVRQLHSWASSLFLASLLANLVVAFFTGAFRRPRRGIWVAGVLLLLVGVLAAFTGALLPDDLLSGTSLRMTSGYLLSIPVIGTWLHWMLFGGEFPGTEAVPRLHVAHLVLPLVVAAQFALRAALLARHGHPQYRGRRGGPGDPESAVVGVRVLPGHAARSAAMFALVVAVLAGMAAVLQVNPVWNYGPANPAHVSAGSTSPWYFGWVDGAVRLWPAWEIRLGEHTIPPWFWPSMVFLPLSFLALALYPVLESRVTRDAAEHHLLQRPRDVPVRTSLGVAVVALYGCLQLAAATDVLALTFDLSGDAVFWAARVGVVVLPVLAYWVSVRICLGLQLADRAVLDHGIETGLLRRLPHGGFVEVHHPLGGLDGHGRPVPLRYSGSPVPKRMNQLGVGVRPSAEPARRDSWPAPAAPRG